MHCYKPLHNTKQPTLLTIKFMLTSSEVQEVEWRFCRIPVVFLSLSLVANYSNKLQYHALCRCYLIKFFFILVSDILFLTSFIFFMVSVPTGHSKYNNSVKRRCKVALSLSQPTTVFWFDWLDATEVTSCQKCVKKWSQRYYVTPYY